MFRTLVVVLFLAFSFNSFAQSTYEFLNLDQSPRAAALAGSFVANIDDPNVVFYNPAGIYNLKNSPASFSFTKHLVEINSASLTYSQEFSDLGRFAAAVQYINYGDFTEAERCYMRALELRPDYAELHASIGALYIYQDKYDQAVQHLEKATKLDSQLPEAWSNLSLAYATVGRFTEADASLKKAIMLGYQNGPIIQDRINNLKAAEHGSR